jgi:hypothetical protein
MDIINAILAILGGILAAAGLIISKKPDAKQLIDKLVPYQAGIGVAMVALGLINFLRLLGYLTDMIKLNLMLGLSIWCMLGTSVALGALFGMPQIVKWIPGNSNAEQKAMELTQKIAPFQVILGLIAIASSVVYLLFRFHIIKIGIL